MNGVGKSDKPIVPKKGANKGSGRPRPAEGLEGRGLAKGNPGEQTRFWTQGQTDLHDALERVRNAAREDKTLRFMALWHHVYNVNRLRHAYYDSIHLNRRVSAGMQGHLRTVRLSPYPVAKIASPILAYLTAWYCRRDAKSHKID